MTWEELMRQIESDSYAIRLGVASGKSIFMDLLEESPELGELLRFLRSDVKAPSNVLNRIRAISAISIDYRYENPYDIALAAYVFSLHFFSRALAGFAAEIAFAAPLTWWAREIARYVLEISGYQDATSTAATLEKPLRISGSIAPGFAGDMEVRGRTEEVGEYREVARCHSSSRCYSSSSKSELVEVPNMGRIQQGGFATSESVQYEPETNLKEVAKIPLSITVTMHRGESSENVTK